MTHILLNLQFFFVFFFVFCFLIPWIDDFSGVFDSLILKISSSFKFVSLDSDLYAETRGRRTERGLRLATVARVKPRTMVWPPSSAVKGSSSIFFLLSSFFFLFFFFDLVFLIDIGFCLGMPRRYKRRWRRRRLRRHPEVIHLEVKVALKSKMVLGLESWTMLIFFSFVLVWNAEISWFLDCLMLEN